MRKRTLFIMAGAMAIGFISGYMLINISEKKQETKNPFFKVADLSDQIESPVSWGQNFPMQYDSYKRTVDQIRTKHGGSEALPHLPTSKDPRNIFTQSKLKEDHRLIKMWLGYAFSKDFREERGHAFMLADQMYSERQDVVRQPGTCLNCHASTYVAMITLGKGDLTKGFEAINKMDYHEAVKHVNGPIACIDCHEPNTMQLRITRPAFIEAMSRMKANQGIKNYDVNKMATRQEMKSFVCGQCHAEYFFDGKEKRLTFPWDNGLKGDDILAYYENNGHKDWEHKITGAKVLKAQHPEFETWNQGIHAKSGVSCVDCHMPYKRVGAMKITDHHIQSPMLNINKSCQTCHHFPEKDLKERVELIQDRHLKMRDQAMNALMELVDEIDKSQKKNFTKNKIEIARGFHRKAQFLLDFVEAENSSGFHAPQESARILMQSLDYIRQGQMALKK